MCAAEAGSEEVVAKLIEVGADVNAQKTGPLLPVMSPGLDDTALHAAVRKNELEIIRMLVQNDADINLQNSFGDSSLNMSIGQGKVLIMKIFFSLGENEYQIAANSIAAAVENNHLDVLKELAERGIELETKSGLALCIAARNNNTEVIDFLLSKNVSIDATSPDFEAIHCASQSGNLGTVKLLISKGANVNATTQDKRLTPLHLSVMSRKLDVSNYLIENKASINFADRMGNTPLHIASKINEIDLVRLLVENGASKNIKNNNGKTPIDEAINEGNIEITDYLRIE
jgi:ankyrin repeat protein